MKRFSMSNCKEGNVVHYFQLMGAAAKRGGVKESVSRGKVTDDR